MSLLNEKLARALVPLSALLITSCAAPALLGAWQVVSLGTMGVSAYNLARGGTVRVRFGASPRGSQSAASLSSFRKIAIWPGNEFHVRFAERLQSSGDFVVISPSAVTQSLSSQGDAQDLSMLTATEREQAYDRVCRVHQADMVFAAIGLGSAARMGIFTPAGERTAYDLIGYDCRARGVAWRDSMNVTVTTSRTTPAPDEVYDAMATALTERLTQGRVAGDSGR